MIVYIAGPITGNENYHSEFAAAAANLTGKGHIAFNPASLPAGLPWEKVHADLVRHDGRM